MSKTLTEMAGKALADAMSVQRCDDDLIHSVERIAEVVRSIAAKLEGEQSAPDVLGRVLELAEGFAAQLQEKSARQAANLCYGIAHIYEVKAHAIKDFADLLRKEFNRE